MIFQSIMHGEITQKQKKTFHWTLPQCFFAVKVKLPISKINLKPYFPYPVSVPCQQF